MALIITRSRRRTSPADTANAPTCCGVSMTRRGDRWECDECFGWDYSSGGIAPGTGHLPLLLAVTAAVGLAAVALTGPGTGRRTRRAARHQGTTALQCQKCNVDLGDDFECPLCHGPVG
ncbi:hypothetical protein GCM10027160_52220 [Streptomyces calidiresistens]|uniref:Uncharacterized protein n=1 Tax=Streptomyces calidiresistens TaxID=1485586 RepID=A0A7W3T1Y7_9ACTN|nr:hypothetical protein [Streptomyces calidiresistens]MBB0229381.1 hypothetical protein [Streptomyces calidiresistens]